ncbi:hypothetical protein FB451DRAFT_1167460 [Mycena latifolia]|nr:hypothetical protein FB451DRAFT_1167460 [Mycena latifolia]
MASAVDEEAQKKSKGPALKSIIRVAHNVVARRHELLGPEPHVAGYEIDVDSGNVYIRWWDGSLSDQWTGTQKWKLETCCISFWNGAFLRLELEKRRARSPASTNCWHHFLFLALHWLPVPLTAKPIRLNM